jgi:hypothetical protein
MSQVAGLRMAFQLMHEFLEGTVADVTDDQAKWQPPGRANSVGANYGHVVFSEDGVINGMLRGGAPLMAGRFADKTGASEPPPRGFEWGEWAGRVKIEMPALREYANAVYASTDEYLASISDADLEREVDMGPSGKWSVGRFLTIMMGNVAMHTGEIACLKGLQGTKGYPF